MAQPLVGGSRRRWDWRLGRSRNKVAVPEGAAGSPPFSGACWLASVAVCLAGRGGWWGWVQGHCPDACSGVVAHGWNVDYWAGRCLLALVLFCIRVGGGTCWWVGSVWHAVGS